MREKYSHNSGQQMSQFVTDNLIADVFRAVAAGATNSYGNF